MEYVMDKKDGTDGRRWSRGKKMEDRIDVIGVIDIIKENQDK